MNRRSLPCLLVFLRFLLTSLVAQADGVPAIFPEEDPQTAADYRLVWPTIPGRNYEVRQSDDLQTWTVVPGFPAVATGPIMQWLFITENTPHFFRVWALDDPPPAPAGMAHIPAGPFQMGDNFHESSLHELPVHTVLVSAFFMDTNLIPREQWLDVYAWALGHGYSFSNAAEFKDAKHPVHTINWYDAVKWCNARSEKEGLAPCYYTTVSQTTVYRSGYLDLPNSAVKWTANGYRLPTEAEWEKAARGGLQDRRFPWGDTASHSQANYYSTTSYAYDISPTREFHPDYKTGSLPYTSPANSFAANGYGLHDMAGNLFQWTWDAFSETWYDQAGATADDTRGPAFVSTRVLRGGYWHDLADGLRCANRSDHWPALAVYGYGFRCVRGL